MIKNIFIDLDDTLWDTYENHKATLHKLYDSLHWERYFASFDDFFADYMPHNDYLWGLYREGKIKKQELIVARFKYPFRAVTSPPADDDFFQINELFITLSQAQTGLVDGALELLRLLREQGRRIMLITNGFAEVQQTKVYNSGIGDYLDFHYVSEKLGVHKPHKHFFDLALEDSRSLRMETVVIGDSWEADIVGASAAGIRSIWFNPRGKKPTSEVDLPPFATIVHLSAIPALLEERDRQG